MIKTLKTFFYISDDTSAPVPVAKPIAAPMPMPMSVAINPPVAASGPVQPPQTSTSWAAAAGKGLPTTTHNEVILLSL